MAIIKKKQQYYLVKAKFDKKELKCLLEYVGKNIPTSLDQNIKVILEEVDKKLDQVIIQKGKKS